MCLWNQEPLGIPVDHRAISEDKAQLGKGTGARPDADADIGLTTTCEKDVLLPIK